MTLDPLHHNHLTALLTGDLDAAARLRQQFRADDHGTATELLRAATAVTLEYRFGPGAGLGASPIHHGRLAAFMSELRLAGRATLPPPDYLAVESVARALYGEPHLVQPLSDQRRTRAMYAVVDHELARYAWLRQHSGHLVDQARQRMTTWILV
ncbi:hypothetical protein [Glycomyces sp. NPDC048151]|uniref:hypothetical protein n=1 Tax=Glycomyces sp. NPDC048151 TaxID=3364002 RepID=UPI0037140DA7